MAPKTTQPATVIFLTDGIANIGLTRPRDIVALARQPKDRRVRLFTFGLGYDVQAPMLDQLALETGGAAEYVRPDEDLELPMSRLFNKVSLPAMTNVRVIVEGAETHDMVPGRIEDLFHGTQVTVLGRYRCVDKASTATVRLTGELYGVKREFRTELVLPERSQGYEWLETLWATRKLATLLDNYRQADDDNSDLKREIEELCRRHNLVSPLTSMLVVEDGPVTGRSQFAMDARLPQLGTNRTVAGRSAGGLGPSPGAAFGGFASVSRASAVGPVEAEFGELAVRRSLEIRKMRDESTVEGAAAWSRADQRQVGSRIFEKTTTADGQDQWVEIADGQAVECKDRTVTLAYLGAGWFELANRKEYRELLQLGSRLTFRVGAVCVVISDVASGTQSEEIPGDLRSLLLP
jgi:Ca-activated chloride channel family protein